MNKKFLFLIVLMLLDFSFSKSYKLKLVGDSGGVIESKLDRFDISKENSFNKINSFDTNSYKRYEDYIIPSFEIDLNLSCLISNINYEIVEKEYLGKVKNKGLESRIYPNSNTINPVSISKSGFCREKVVNSIQYSPFIVENDSIFFINKVEYSFNKRDDLKPIEREIGGNNNLDYLIVTTSVFNNSIDQLKSSIEKRGFRVEVITLSSIMGNYSGINIEEKIRECIKDYYKFRGIEYVLLVGNSSNIPVPILKPYSGYEYIPSDIYYSNLDGNFDENNNGILAESVDNSDLFPEVMIGRLPISSNVDLEIYIDKLNSYYNGDFNSHKKNFIMGFNLFFPGDYEFYCNYITGAIPQENNNTIFYEETTPNFNYDTVSEVFDNSYNFIFSQSHGNYDRIGQVYGWTLSSKYIEEKINPSAIFLVSACIAGSIDIPSFASTVIRSSGGGLNYVGSSVTEYPGVSYIQNKLYAEKIHDSHNVGESFNSSKMEGFTNIYENNYSRLLYHSYSNSGDPSFSIVTDDIDISLSVLEKRLDAITFKIDGSTEGNLTKLSIFDGTNFKSSHYVDGNGDISVNIGGVESDSITVFTYSSKSYLKRHSFPVDDYSGVEIKSISLDENSLVINPNQTSKLKGSFKVYNYSNYENLKVLIKNEDFDYLNFSCDSLIFPITNGFSNLSVDLLDLYVNDNFILENDTTINLSFDLYLDNNHCLSYDQPITIANPKITLLSTYFDNNGNSLGFIIENRNRLGEDPITINLKHNGTTIDSYSFTLQLNNEIYLKNIFSTDPNKSYSITISYDETEIEYKNIEYNYLSDNSFKFSFIQKVGDIYNIFWKLENSIECQYKIINNNGDIFGKGLMESSSFSLDVIDLSDSYKILVISGNSVVLTSEYITPNQQTIQEGYPKKVSNISIKNPIVNGNRVYIPTKSNDYFMIEDEEILPFYTQEGTMYGGDNNYGMAFGDIDGDGEDEVVSNFFTFGDSSEVQVHNHEGLLLTSKIYYGFLFNQLPVLHDIDKDGDYEIFITCFDDNLEGLYGGIIYGFDYVNGSLKLIENYPITSQYNDYRISSPIFGDFNNDGSEDIVFNSSKNLRIGNSLEGNIILTKTHETNICGPVKSIDLNGDGNLEIIVSTENNTINPGKIYVYNLIGDSDSGYILVDFPGFEGGVIAENYKNQGLGIRNDSPVIADLDKNGSLEIIYLTGKKLYILESDGTPYRNFPIDVNSINNDLNSPTIVDFDNDGYRDILTTTHDGLILCWSGYDGSIVENFPIFVPDNTNYKLWSTPVVDIDGDGDYEILGYTGYGDIYLYDNPVKLNDDFILQNMKYDLRNSGNYNFIELTDIEENIVDSFELLGNYPNPFNPSTTISFNIDSPGNIDFNVYNIKGETVYSKSYNYRDSGLKSINFSGEFLSSGLYFYLLKKGEISKTGKMVMVK
ncbi:MAG: hypothetical protein CR982_03845 [Candidatus Cloacimonadota bacterium]|nr:MAG: hypothetical protein CR982_03845 [Candidatus Cloacimonadota bacterium]PIE78017.1 MAG: hypothetical protein CSA15_09980 [Candidatus Delongbacteria bacterium]